MTNAIKENILFVDDEEDILEVATEFFDFKGYQVFTAKNGREAISILESEKIDCCFTDINMPEMDGLELAEYIRKNDNTIPVVIMTGYPSLENTIKTLKNGVVDYLIKPVNLNQVEITVQRVLRERRLFIENILLAKEVEGKERLAKLNKELLYKVEELYTLNRIMSEFTTISTSSELFNKVVDATMEIARADGASFFLVNEAVDKPYEVVSKSSAPNGDLSADSPELRKLIGEIMVDDVPLLISDNRNAGNLPPSIRSFMMVPLKIREKIFGVLTARVTASPNRFTEKDLYYLSFMTNKAAYTIENLALYENIYENLFSTLYAFVKTIEARDPYTQQHSSRVTSIAVAIGKEMRCTNEELDILNFSGMLHDIGKIGIRDDILLKPGRLTAEEFEKIKEHPAIGASIVEQLGLWDREKEIIRCHHERWDGAGYPGGLNKENIPILARILSVADVYDAIASDRAYRKKMEEERILKIINEGAGAQFDPNVVDVFNKLYEDGIILEYTAK
jgi:putative nucleotidyltransferase with HDIG domain